MAKYDMKPPYDAPGMVASQDELKDARVPIEYRDFCSHLLIPLNSCRRSNFWMPWACGHERHEYELCQYADYKRRVLKQEYVKNKHKYGLTEDAANS